jgi:plastocyanin
MTFVHRTWRLAFATGVLLFAAALALPVLAGPLDVSIVDRSFQPATITVQAGDTVTWTVTKAVGEPHSVTSGSPGADQGKQFDSGIGLKDNGLTFQFTFQQPGTYSYFCQVHPTLMTGQVVVVAAGASAPATSAGPAASPPAPSSPAASPVATASPAASPASGASAAASEPPVAPEAAEPVAPERKLIAAGILAAALVLLFGAAWFWRRMNPA